MTKFNRRAIFPATLTMDLCCCLNHKLGKDREATQQRLSTILTRCLTPDMIEKMLNHRSGTIEGCIEQIWDLLSEDGITEYTWNDLRNAAGKSIQFWMPLIFERCESSIIDLMYSSVDAVNADFPNSSTIKSSGQLEEIEKQLGDNLGLTETDWTMFEYEIDNFKIRPPLLVLISGAADQLGCMISSRISDGTVFGKEQPVQLVLLDIPQRATDLEELIVELQDCAFPTLHSVKACTELRKAFVGVDYAFLIGSMSRLEGMKCTNWLTADLRLFKAQGKALADFAKPTTKVIVVGNRSNTNAFIAAKYAAGKVPAKNFSAMTRLEHNRALGQLALKTGTTIGDVKNVIIWGNQSSTLFPDTTSATIRKNGAEQPAATVVNDNDFLTGELISVIQKIGTVFDKKTISSSAMSAAKAACDHIHDWHFGTRDGEFVSMAVTSDGSYGIPEGLVFSFPVIIDVWTKKWKIVQGLTFDDCFKTKIAVTLEELEKERDNALKACEDANI